MENPGKNESGEKKVRENISYLTKIKNSPVTSFIFRYPRLSGLVLVVIIVIIAFLPLSPQEKAMIPLRALGLGLLIAIGIYCFRLLKRSS